MMCLTDNKCIIIVFSILEHNGMPSTKKNTKNS